MNAVRRVNPNPSKKDCRYVVKWQSRFTGRRGQFPPASKPLADKLVADLSRLFADYRYWQEEVASA